uniref:RING-type domain-containing protein n=1 Tax=Biomphalaria glabrata TaxID=6526 RepID=A0A2C9LWZ6_BIOGL
MFLIILWLQESVTKNPGHFAYFNLPSLRLEQIPSKHRCTEMLVFLKLLGDLTVKLIVSKTSDLRRNPNYKMIHGTGFVIQHEGQLNTFSQKDEKSKFKSLKTYFPFASKKDVGCVFIQTSRHLVANDEEARNTIVEFFYDSAERKNIVTLKGKYLLGNVIPGDSRCLLVCESSDLRFTERINHLQTEFTKAVNNLPLKAKKGMLKKLFMIHHPHGGPKVLSYGDFVQVKYKTMTSNGNTTLVKLGSQEQAEQDLSLYRKALFYAVDTCPGSCGAPFLTFCSTVEGNTSAGFTHDLWMHDGVEPTHKLGASVLKVCTADDFIPPRAEGGQPDEDSDDEGTLGKEQVNSPVYKVISTPSHPEYILFQSRLDSYRVWPYSEILNPQRLASCGFYYTGDQDCVRCFQCGLGLRSWKPGDDVLAQHEKYRPTCPYLQSSPKDVSTGAIADTSFTQSEENMELKLLESENTKLKQQLMCKVCFKSEIKDVFLPCGELYACSDCSKLLTHCPSCKKQILATVTVYLT